MPTTKQSPRPTGPAAGSLPGLSARSLALASVTLGAPVTYDVSASDEHDGTVTPTCDPPSGSTFPIGSTTVNCSAQDSAGNRATKSFLVVLTAS